MAPRAGRNAVLVEERAQLGLRAALEIQRFERRFEAHLDARAAASPRPAAVAGEQLGLAELAGEVREVEAEHDAAADHAGLRRRRVEVEFPRQLALGDPPDARRKLETERRVLTRQ